MEDLRAVPVLVSGDRPTGRLHLGHWVGSLRERVAAQGDYRCFFLVADLHFLTTHAARSREAAANVAAMVLDWLSVGIDPARSSFVLQSQVPEISELAVLLSMICPVARARRIPALKEKIRDLGAGERYSLGLLGYPVLMAADVLSFRATAVPVGADQAGHLELARELASRFNRLYGPTFPEPRLLESAAPRLVGTDGFRKMSKSLDNAIYLSDDAETVERRVRSMYTDPRRVRSDVPGTVEGNPVFAYHDLFNADRAEVEDLRERYRAGRVGDVEVKAKLARALNAFLEPIRRRRQEWEGRIEEVRALLREGTAAARPIAQDTLGIALRRLGLAAQ
jgi:tryptophanyl-tRNA synthetase